MENPIDKLKYERAKERLTELKAFYIMLIGSCLLIPFLIFLNHHFIPEFRWFWFPVVGCLFSIIYYGFQLFAGKKWEEKKIRELFEKDKFKN